MVKHVHQSVTKESLEFLSTLRRYNYVTPTSYLEVLRTYRNVLTMKRLEVGTLKNRLQVSQTFHYQLIGHAVYGLAFFEWHGFFEVVLVSRVVSLLNGRTLSSFGKWLTSQPQSHGEPLARSPLHLVVDLSAWHAVGNALFQHSYSKQVGLDKIISTQEQVGGLQEQLTDMEPVLIKTQAEVEGMIVTIVKDKEEASKTQREVKMYLMLRGLEQRAIPIHGHLASVVRITHDDQGT